MPLVTQCSNSVIAVMSDDIEDAERFAKTHFIPLYFDNVKKMLESAEVDVVYIASPHLAHYEEKPLLLTAESSGFMRKTVSVKFGLGRRSDNNCSFESHIPDGRCVD